MLPVSQKTGIVIAKGNLRIVIAGVLAYNHCSHGAAGIAVLHSLERT
jgi:hypothetical protein